MHVLMNGLSIGSGGGFTVGRMLHRHLALARPGWKVTLMLTEGNSLHRELERLERPGNAELLWAPPRTARYRSRLRHERHGVGPWCEAHGVGFLLQLSATAGAPGGVPVFSLFQDPLPYRPQAWSKRLDWLRQPLKRRAMERTLGSCTVAGWTSGYLERLVTGHHGIRPRDSRVLYNGIRADWVDRDRASLTPWAERPLRILTVSNVAGYKRQVLVIDAVALLHAEGVDARYHICGHGTPGDYAALRTRAEARGVGDRVHVEGRVSEQRVEELFGSSRCYCLMSLCESFGIGAVEAMSFGTPVVVADCCAIPEVCNDPTVLCPVDDVHALRDRLRTALLSPEATAGQIRRGFENIERFRWPRIAEEVAVAMEENAGLRDAPARAPSPSLEAEPA